MEGNPGDGKTSMLTDIAARETQELTMPASDIAGTGGSVLWISDEDAPATLRRNLAIGGAKLSKVLIYNKTADRRLVFPADAPKLEEMIAANHCTLTVVDPIASFLDGSANVEKVIRDALSPLTKVAERTRSAIVLVRHLRKGGGCSALYRGMGGIGLIAAARSGLLIGKEPGVALQTQQPQRIVAQFKSSLAAPAESLAFRLMPDAGGVRVEWSGSSNYTAEQLLTASGSGEATALSEACHVLYSLLGDGPLWVNHVKQLAGRSGVSARTLQRAKELLGVMSLRDGFGRGARYFWALPDGNELVSRLKEKDLGDLADALINGRPDSPEDPSANAGQNRRPPRGFRDILGEDDDDPSDWWKRQ
jgi:hypothetical protein